MRWQEREYNAKVTSHLSLRILVNFFPNRSFILVQCNYANRKWPKFCGGFLCEGEFETLEVTNSHRYTVEPFWVTSEFLVRLSLFEWLLSSLWDSVFSQFWKKNCRNNFVSVPRKTEKKRNVALRELPLSSNPWRIRQLIHLNANKTRLWFAWTEVLWSKVPTREFENNLRRTGEELMRMLKEVVAVGREVHKWAELPPPQQSAAVLLILSWGESNGKKFPNFAYSP